MHAPTEEAELPRAATDGDPAAAAALWDAHGPGAYAFAYRVLGDTEAAAGVAREAFLVARGGLPVPRHRFRLSILGAARIASFERVASAPSRHAARGRLSAATGRLRPQQRAALALAGLERLSYAQIAAVLGIAVESVPALLARARLRLHDELHGTGLAAAAVRSPDCEDVLPVLGAAADGELDASDSAWADPHLARCPTCVRTVRTLRAVTETYTAWSPAPAPAWLREATLAAVGAEATRPGAGSGSPALGALSAALLGATCVTGAFAALLVGTARSLHEDGSVAGGARIPQDARSTQLAAAPHRVHRARRARDVGGAAFVVARLPQAAPAIRRHPPAPLPTPRPKRRQAAPPKEVPAPPPTTTPADDVPVAVDDAAPTTAAAAVVATEPAPEPPPATPTAPPATLDAAGPPLPSPPDTEDDGDGWTAGARGWHDRPAR